MSVPRDVYRFLDAPKGLGRSKSSMWRRDGSLSKKILIQSLEGAVPFPYAFLGGLENLDPKAIHFGHLRRMSPRAEANSDFLRRTP